MSIRIDHPELLVSPTEFFRLEETTRIKPSIGLKLSDRSYLPKADQPRADWVASVAVPAFKTLARMGFLAPRFCTVGTGAGLDVLAAVEILKARTVGFTDLHEDVLDYAHENVRSNLLDQDIELLGGAGDILAPLAGQLSDVDVIYENLPNIPMAESGDLADGQTSSTFISARSEEVPSFVEKYLMTLHYLALQQARPFLRVGGRVLSSIGGRVPLPEALAMSRAAGYNSSILTYTWKVQSEPDEVVGGYARWEREGLGPFHFYPVGLLRSTFQGVSAATAGAQALEIEEALAPHSIPASDALALVEKGEEVGHTVVILDSVKVPDSLD
ncbi:class I SAM-dependent methyltransferase [Streptomyces hokutonensis]|uniref:class I SAM-dependent methyltransferase n=1 Tax=Streptomyces hokutonensis TaxID=1306990 RepID=UPI00369E50FA